jgi:hypothetical protein
MADTGSTDGSRAIAERYADVVFDFPWVNDFSAARNAVLERCTGRWTLTLDCDEWLDGAPEELISFLREARSERYDFADVIQRNYIDAPLTHYNDVLIARMMRMDAKPRYIGAIHELPEGAQGGSDALLTKTVLHHDGYVMLNNGSDEGEAKRRRNVELLRKELQRNPDDLRRLLQFVESGDREPDRDEMLRRAIALVKKKVSGWDSYGAPLLSYAVQLAYQNELPERDAWANDAQALFPDSYFTRIDAGFIIAACRFERQDFAGAARACEAYLQSRRDYARDEKGCLKTAVSSLQRDDDGNERDMLVVLARSYVRLGQAEKALSLLGNWKWEETDARCVRNYLVALQDIQSCSSLDVTPALLACRDGIRRPLPDEERARERMAVFNEFCTVPDEEPPSEELRQLAERIRAILARFPADDPAVVELKNSPQYQKVAYLIEE